MNRTQWELSEIPAGMRQYFEEFEAKCGKPWVRVTEKPQPPDEIRNRGNGAKMDFHSRQTGSGQKLQDWYNEHPATTLGFRAACRCEVYRMRNDLTSEEQAYVLAEMERARAVV